MATTIELVLDCADPDRLADFWSAAIGYRRLGTAGNHRSLVPVDGASGPKLTLQGVAEPRRAKNRMHLDILAPDIEAEAERLVRLGAIRISGPPVEEHDTRWIVMADPEGLERQPPISPGQDGLALIHGHASSKPLCVKSSLLGAMKRPLARRRRVVGGPGQ